ncbi:MAG TPA: CcdB family protein [Sphingobium sp.]|nr:CcdB family protein [Sphingobium sp.]
MARFDVYSLQKGGGYVLDCQADILAHIGTRFVVPLMPVDTVPAPLGRLHPRFEVEGETLIMATHLAASVPVRSLGKPILSLASAQDVISGALDMLLVGF